MQQRHKYSSPFATLSRISEPQSEATSCRAKSIAVPGPWEVTVSQAQRSPLLQLSLTTTLWFFHSSISSLNDYA